MCRVFDVHVVQGAARHGLVADEFSVGTSSSDERGVGGSVVEYESSCPCFGRMLSASRIHAEATMIFSLTYMEWKRTRAANISPRLW